MGDEEGTQTPMHAHPQTNNTVHVSLSNVSLPRLKNKESKFVFLAVWYQSAIVFCLFVFLLVLVLLIKRSGGSCLGKSRKIGFLGCLLFFFGTGARRHHAACFVHRSSFCCLLLPHSV